MTNTGLMHVYYGYGKGKTTAAMGLAARAAGRGLPVVIVQFMKDQDSGELASLEKLGIPVFRGCGETLHCENLQKALDIMQGGGCRLLILDEAMDALQHGELPEQLLRQAIEQRPNDVELVVTGHKPEAWVLEKADYITEMVKQRHPYDRGISAREYIEY